MRNENEHRDTMGEPAGSGPAAAPGQVPASGEAAPAGQAPAPGSGLAPERSAAEVARTPGSEPTYGMRGPAAGTGAERGLHSRFEEIRTQFIDNPREAVRSADSLVEEAVDRVMGDLRQRMEEIRSEVRGDADTERLRQAMQRYREMIGRLAQF